MGLWQLEICRPCLHWLWAATVYPPDLAMRDVSPLEMSFPMPRACGLHPESLTQRRLVLGSLSASWGCIRRSAVVPGALPGTWAWGLGGLEH